MLAGGITSLGVTHLKLESELEQNYGPGWVMVLLRRKKSFKSSGYDNIRVSIDDRWQGLRNALAGLFCASLGSLDEQRTTSPHLSFTPVGFLPEWDLPHRIRHASLPSEHVCTENLTPFLKLLPCKSLSGIAMLLNPHKLFDADWHGMGIHVVWNPDQGVEVELTFQLVSDPLRYSQRRKQGLYIIVSPTHGSDDILVDWSFMTLYDRTISRSCPVATTSEIFVSLPTTGMYSITPEPSIVEENRATFDLASGSKLSYSTSINDGCRFYLTTQGANLLMSL